MDHLYLPEGARLLEEDRVYYKGSTSYLQCRFLQFADLKGYSFLSQLAPTEVIQNYDQLTAPDNFDAFLQEWLFCSFLKEVFGNVPQQMFKQNMFEHTDFVHSAADPNDQSLTLLCTASLPHLAERWLCDIPNGSKQSLLQYEHLVKCVSTVASTLSLLAIRQPQIIYNPKTIAVVANVIDFIVSMISKAFENHAIFRDHPIDQGSWMLFGQGHIYLGRLVNLGWCPYEAASIAFKSPNLQIMHFCIYMKRYLRLNHSQCTTAACQARNNSGDLEKPQHRSNCSRTCGAYAIEGGLEQKMLDIIRSDGRPVLRMRNVGGNTAIDLECWNGKDKYVALSHIWSDGMGNKDSNSVYRCQLENLYWKLMQIPNAQIATDRDEVLVWIDTICCPVQAISAQGEKGKVLSQMVRIYEDAALVFVLDSELQSIDRPSSLLETAFRVLTSEWMHRLWTLQEGFVARAIWVQFKNEAFMLDQDKMMSLKDDLMVSQYWIGRIVKTMYFSLRRRLVEENTEIRRQNLSTYTTMALQNRSVSHAYDEPLCLAILLNLDVKQIAAIKTTENNCTYRRMAKFWDLLENSAMGISKSILFHHEPKVLLDGYRWAPASLLGQAALPLMATLFGGSALLPDATITRKGLRVLSEGLLISTSHRRLEYLQQAYPGWVDVDITRDKKAYLRDTDGRWFSFSRKPDANNSQTTTTSTSQNQPAISNQALAVEEAYKKAADRQIVQYGIIFRDNIINRTGLGQSQPSGLALLVALHPPEGDQAHRVTALETVTVAQVLPAQAAFWEIEYQLANQVRESEAYKLGVDATAVETCAKDLIRQRIESNPALRALESTPAMIQTRQEIENNPATRNQGLSPVLVLLLAPVLKMVAGSFGMDVEFQSADQVWYVD